MRKAIAISGPKRVDLIQSRSLKYSLGLQAVQKAPEAPFGDSRSIKFVWGAENDADGLFQQPDRE